MKYVLTLFVAMFAVSAHAQLLVPKGTKGTLKVTYQFKSEGKVAPPSGERISIWKANRIVEITGQYVAEGPQAFGAVHKEDAKQKKDMATLQSTIESTQKTMQPTMNDMMKIADKCNEDEACIEREIMAYGQQMDPNTIKAGKAGVEAATGMATAQRFQMWKLTSQQGTYKIDETVSKQVFEMTCTQTQVCKRTEIRTGGGVITPPAGTKATDGVSLLEVDTVNKDMAVMLPTPLGLLPYKQVVTSSIEGEPAGTTETVMPPWMLKANQPAPVSIPGDLKTVSGTQTYKVEGEEHAGGTITVNWTFTRL